MGLGLAAVHGARGMGYGVGSLGVGVACAVCVFTADLIHLVVRTDVSEVSDFLMNIVNDADIAGYGKRPHAEFPSFERMIVQKWMKTV